MGAARRHRHPQPAAASAGAGSGVYNTTRQVGAVLGSAAIAAVIQARLAADLPGLPSTLGGMQGSGTAMPPQDRRRVRVGDVGVHAAPGRGARLGVVAALFFERPASHPH